MARRASHLQSRSVKGWKAVAPKLRSERQATYERCGAAAFLLPNKRHPGKSKFPVMPKQGACVVDCRALRAAKARAAQTKHPTAKRKADKLASRGHCSWR